MLSSELIQFLNQNILAGEKRLLLQLIADHPDRFNALFCVHPAKTRLLQAVLAEREARFSNAVRELIKILLKESGFLLLPERVQDSEGNDLAVNPHFGGGKAYYFLDLRLRDDLDKAQRHSLMAGFEARLEAMHRLHGSNLVGILYFLDPNLIQQRTLFAEELAKLRRDHAVELHLFYGLEFFAYLGQPSMWQELVGSINEWKATHVQLPDLDFDLNSQTSFEELRVLEQRCWWNLLLEESLWEGGVIQALFPSGQTLRLLRDYFASQSTAPYPLLTRALEKKLELYWR